MTACFTKYSCA